VRHGQAGTRNAYDCLSELGKHQARLLGDHFLAQGLRFALASTGTLARQHQTAEQIHAAYSEAGTPFPSIDADPGWNEFDLGRLSRELAPHLCAQDPEFRREYQEMLEQVRISNGLHTSRVHRKWLPCDTKIVEAWMGGRFPFTGETWSQFCDRVRFCRSKLDHREKRENILVVTSATPIALWTGLSLEISDQRVMRLAGVLHNASYTILRLRQEQLRLFTFNAASHLAAPGLRTHR